MINEAKIQTSPNDINQALLDIFKIWIYKRHVREGSKEKLLSYNSKSLKCLCIFTAILATSKYR